MNYRYMKGMDLLVQIYGLTICVRIIVGNMVTVMMRAMIIVNYPLSKEVVMKVILRIVLEIVGMMNIFFIGSGS